MSDKNLEFKDREIEEVNLENVSGGKNETLTRVDSPNERRALQELGYVVVKDLYTGHYFVKDWKGR
ncbi:MAG: hypothetical protein RUMPE_00714 [Eubacteriales bacterium SKADARSKE-1]|nr:hypothetical protein [Eubacteriales bacterium SKADARSKE-1]